MNTAKFPIATQLLRRSWMTTLKLLSSRFTVSLTVATCLVGTYYQWRRSELLVALLFGAFGFVLIAKEIYTHSRERALLLSVLDAATEIAIFTTDDTGRLTIFNKGAENILGYNSNEVVGKYTLDQFHDADELGQHLDRIESDPGPDVVLDPIRKGSLHPHDWTYIRKDGRRLTVSLVLSTLRHGAGFLGIAADVTAKREQERDRERLLRLEREITQKLIAQNDELQRMDRTKDEFVATVSHEFRTPLTSIKGYVEALMDGSAGELNDRQIHFLEIIERNSERLNRLVEDLLLAARVDAGGTSVAVFSELQLSELITEVAESAEPHARSKDINLQVAADPEIVLAADPARFSQLLDNLVSNAIKFTPEGGAVYLDATRSEDSAIITVRDTGIGIPEDEQSRLFKRFFRSRLATENAINGTGIGLALVKEIADAHGATIDVKSKQGEGTTVQIVVPALIPVNSW